MKIGPEQATKLSSVSSKAEFASVLHDLSDAIDASVFTAQYFQTGDHGMSAWSTHNVPTGLLENFGSSEAAKVDPVMQHLRRSPSPIVWSRDTYLSAQNADWEILADHGCHQGASIALHLGGSRHFVLGLCWRDQSALARSARDVAMYAVQVLAVFAEPAAYRMWSEFSVPAGTGCLSRRERECLDLVCRGFNDELIAAAMGISYRGVRKHIEMLMQKLGCANRTEAAVRATKLGLAGGGSL